MRLEKESILKEVQDQVRGSDFMFLTGYHGLTVGQLRELRKVMKPCRVQVVKNRLLKRVAPALESPRIAGCLVGPTAVVFGRGDVAEAAKALRNFIKANKKLPVVKAGTLGPTVLTAADVAELADLPSRKEMQARLVRTIAAPMSNLVGVLSQKLLSIVYVLKDVQRKKEQAT